MFCQAVLGNIRAEVGYLRYVAGGPSKATIAGAVLGVLLPIIIILIIVFILLRRRRQLKGRNKIVLPPPNAVPNTYLENKDSADHAEGAAGE